MWCEGRLSAVCQAFEERTRELEAAVDKMIPPAIHDALKRELDDVSIRPAAPPPPTLPLPLSSPSPLLHPRVL
jgi:hypothetical protein